MIPPRLQTTASDSDHVLPVTSGLLSTTSFISLNPVDLWAFLFSPAQQLLPTFLLDSVDPLSFLLSLYPFPPVSSTHLSLGILPIQLLEISAQTLIPEVWV